MCAVRGSRCRNQTEAGSIDFRVRVVGSCVDATNLEVQKSNGHVLEQTLKQTHDRFDVGEVTLTDVAQSQAQLAAGKTQELAAESQLTTTRSNFRRIIGTEPTNLAPDSPVDRFLPSSAAFRTGETAIAANPAETRDTSANG